MPTQAETIAALRNANLPVDPAVAPPQAYDPILAARMFGSPVSVPDAIKALGMDAPGVGYVPTTTGPSNVPAQYVKGLAKSAKDLLTGPGDIASGVREEGDWPQEMASSMLGAGGARGLAGEAGELGIFGGRGARGADLPKLYKAQAMETLGHDAPTIYDQTGWFRGADKQWRFEIPDTNAIASQGGGQTVGDVLEHPELFSNYPDLRSVGYRPGMAAGKASYHPAKDVISQNIGWSEDPMETTSVLLHELQHAVQTREGFAPGGSPSSLMPLAEKVTAGTGLDPLAIAREAYARHAGEVESRNVQSRFEFAGSPLQDSLSYGQYPWLTEDRPRNVQVVRPPTQTDNSIQEALSLKERDKSNPEDAYFNSMANTKSFDIMQEGKKTPAGRIHVTQLAPDRLFIQNMYAGKNSAGAPNSLGASEIRSLLGSIKEQYPDATKISGYRVTGAKDQAGKIGLTSVGLPAVAGMVSPQIDEYIKALQGQQ